MPRWVESAPRILRGGFVETTTRVRWNECDRMGHAYYGSYTAWFDLGREQFAMEVGITDFWTYQIPTVEFQVRYHRAAEYLDDLVIRTWASTPTARLDCHYELYRSVGGQLLAEARSSHALVSEKGLRMRAPEHFHERFEAFLGRHRSDADTSTVTSGQTT